MNKIFTTILILLPYLLLGQGENNIWVNSSIDLQSFCIIDFNDALGEGSNPAINIHERSFSETRDLSSLSSASICDKEGNLLFFINNEVIYTNEFQMMPYFAVNGVIPNDSFNHSKFLIVKRPWTESQYYVIQYRLSYVGPSRLSYCIVDMDLNGGLGDVIPEFSDILIDNSRFDIFFTNSISVVKGNCDEFWLTKLFRHKDADEDKENNIQYYYAAYHITGHGISTKPVIRNFVVKHNYVSTLAISSKLGKGFIYSDKIYMYNFDKSNGFLTDETILIEDSKYKNFGESRMIFDSSEDNLMVMMEPYGDPSDDAIPRGFQLYNFNFSDTNISQIKKSFKNLIYRDSSKITSVKLGPDDNYYFHFFDYNKENEPVKYRFGRIIQQSHREAIIDLDLPMNGLSYMGHFPSDNAFWFKGDIFNPSQLALVCHPEHKITLDGVPESSNYLWSTGETTPSILGSLGNTYWVRSDMCGAIYYDTFVVLLRQDSLSGGISKMETDVCSGGLLTFTSNGDSTSGYLWRNERGQVLGSEITIQSNVYYPGKVYLDETTRDGCTYTDSITFITTYPCCDLLIPNSFSPNGDGLNDVFRIVAEADKQIEMLHIYNRYGQLVYKTTDMYDRWDGTYLGLPLPIGVYYYVLLYRCYGNDETLQTKKGDITLVR